MKEVKKTQEFKERDEIEEYFADAKKREFPIGIFLTIIIVILIGIATYYYFVIDNPKTLFIDKINEVLDVIKENIIECDTQSINFEIEPNITTNNIKYIEIIDIINKLSLKGKIEEDRINNRINLDVITLYKNKHLLQLQSNYYQKNIYIKSNELYNKILKIDLDNTTERTISPVLKNYNYKTTNKISKSLINNIEKILIKAKFQKNYGLFDGKLAKRITMIIDRELLTQLCNQLINDRLFTENFSKLNEIPENVLKEEIEKIMTELTNKKIVLSINLSISDNNFISSQLDIGEKSIYLNKNNDEYNYKYYETEIIKFQGKILLRKENNPNNIEISVDDIKNQIITSLNIKISKEYNKEIDYFDITNIIDYQKLTIDNINEIKNNITKQENLNDLYQDIITIINN